MAELEQNLDDKTNTTCTIDVVIVGAGFSGLYMLYCLRKLGISVQIFEAANGVGGTWYWNRYPGARCDIESLQYSYTFSEELRKEWHWTERFAAQPEILRYLNYVADKFDLRKDIQFGTRVTNAIFDETISRWDIQTDRGTHVSAKFYIMATGCLSTTKLPNINGLDTFKGDIYHTGQWPHEPVDFNNRRVAVIGTGSSGIQSIPIIAKQAAHLYVFQRTPSFCIPAQNGPLNEEEEKLWNDNYLEHRREALTTLFGLDSGGPRSDGSAMAITPEERQKLYEARWDFGGLSFLTVFNDLVLNKDSNDTAADFVRSKIRTIVKDPNVAETLLPQNYPIGAKRICLDTQYYETYNRDNVTLINLRKESIEEITPVGLKTNNKTYEVDTIVFATGFDAMTGALLNIDIRGRSGYMLREKWAEGPRTYLGIMTANFPNLFIITGPGSPSVLTSMTLSIEQHVEWVAECIDYLQKHHIDSIDPTMEAEDAWTKHVSDVANMTLFPLADSWYVGANIPGKPRVFMVYVAGIPTYFQKCKDVATNGYEGFLLQKCQPASSTAAN